MDTFRPEAAHLPGREAKLLSGLNKSGLGLEIGASINPLVRPDMGARFKTLDHLSQEDLIEKYRGNPDVNIDNIGKVDFVWSGQPFVELVGDERFDWIVASHVIEHAPDVIGFLQNCQSILKDDGVLSLAIPDRRYTFDMFRPPTGLAWIIDAHLNGEKRPSPGAVIEFGLYGTRRNGQPAWDKSYVGGEFDFIGVFDGAHDLMTSIHQTGEYRDCHVTVYTPSSFRLILENLVGLGLVQLREARFFDTEGNEFFIHLSKSGKGSPLSRMQLAAMAMRET